MIYIESETSRGVSWGPKSSHKLVNTITESPQQRRLLFSLEHKSLADLDPKVINIPKIEAVYVIW